jgi:hypothetical protein
LKRGDDSSSPLKKDAPADDRIAIFDEILKNEG